MQTRVGLRQACKVAGGEGRVWRVRGMWRMQGGAYAAWVRRITTATTRQSAPPAMNMPGGKALWPPDRPYC